MHITWFGQTCVKLQMKHLDTEAVILIDAYKPDKGLFPRSFSPDVALFSKGAEKAATLSQNPFTISSLGEFEIKNAMIYAILNGTDNIIFRVNAEGLTIVHLGRMTQTPTNGEMEKILNPDILIIPVGGKPNYLEPEVAANLVSSLEPRVIVPTAYKCDTNPGAKPLVEFIKELGIKPEATEKKIIIRQKDLPQEEMKLYILEKES